MKVSKVINILSTVCGHKTLGTKQSKLGPLFKSTLAWKYTSVGIRWLLVSKQECEMHKQLCTTHRDSKGQVSTSESSTRLEARGSQMEILPIAGLTFHQGPYVKGTKKASKTTHALEHPTQYAKMFYFTCTVSPKMGCFFITSFHYQVLIHWKHRVEPPYIILLSKIHLKNIIIIKKASFLHYTHTENHKITFNSWFFSYTYIDMHI